MCKCAKILKSKQENLTGGFCVGMCNFAFVQKVFSQKAPVLLPKWRTSFSKFWEIVIKSNIIG